MQSLVEKCEYAQLELDKCSSSSEAGEVKKHIAFKCKPLKEVLAQYYFRQKINLCNLETVLATLSYKDEADIHLVDTITTII